MPAVTKVLPESRYQFCQAHYLRNLAAPLAEADAAFNGCSPHRPNPVPSLSDGNF
jgi:transposase-like protein